ncbi:MAG: hypothetical protein AAGB93_04700 [Planctomycetota bacterium]
MQRLARRFVPAVEAIEDMALDDAPDVEAFFLRMTRHGNASGLAFTDQGVYLATSTGKLLASGNKLEPDELVRAMEEALEKYDALTERARVRRDPLRAPGPDRLEALRPEDGLVLSQFTRTRAEPRGRRAREPRFLQPDVNFDHVWLSAREARSLVPAGLRAGESYALPRVLVDRLARFHVVGTARAIAAPYAWEDLEQATLDARVVSIEGDRVRLDLAGRVRAHDTTVGRIEGRAPVPQQRTRGYDLVLRGQATFDRAAGRFTAFELVADGVAWGGSRFAPRGDRPYSSHWGLAPEDDALARTKPLHLEHYAAALRRGK